MNDEYVLEAVAKVGLQGLANDFVLPAEKNCRLDAAHRGKILTNLAQKNHSPDQHIQLVRQSLK